jgi:uncharacterized protein (DUF3820 family)
MNPDDLKKLVTVAMPFGKYKGRVIADLPGYYLNWFVREGVAVLIGTRTVLINPKDFQDGTLACRKQFTNTLKSLFCFRQKSYFCNSCKNSAKGNGLLKW